MLGVRSLVRKALFVTLLYCTFKICERVLFYARQDSSKLPSE